MRTIARETTFKVALRYCPKATEGKVSIYVILVKGEYTQSSTYFFLQVFASLMKVIVNFEKHMSPWRVFSTFLDMRRYKSWIHKIDSWKYWTIWRPVLPVSPRVHSASFLRSSEKSALFSELLSEGFENQNMI